LPASPLAYEHDDELRIAIVSIFDEAQVLPTRRTYGCRLSYIEFSTGYRVKDTACSNYRCPLCEATSEMHFCPYEPKKVDWCCAECGSIDREHACVTSRMARLEAHERKEKERRRKRKKDPQLREHYAAYQRAWRERKRAEREVAELPTAAE
jgi:hypothetical protein